MPNLLVRVTRYILRSRKRSASLQSSTKATSPAVQLSGGGDASVHEKESINTPEISVKHEKHKRESRDGILAVRKPQAEKEKPAPDFKASVGSTFEQQLGANQAEQTSTKQKPDATTIEVSSSSTQPTTVRTRRVLRELQFMLKASNRPENPFQVSLVDESNIFEWDVRLMRVDETSELWRSMRQTETDCIRFRLTFPELFPFQPPFLRLVGPYLDNGFIMDGGAICMEVLTSQGWSSAYTVESLLVQVASGLTQGGAVVSSKQRRKYNQLSQKRAEAEFRRICKIHAKYGWVSMEREDA